MISDHVFRNASTLIKMSNDSVIAELLAEMEVDTVEPIISSLENQDERVYTQVHSFFAERGMSIQAIGGESIKELIEVVGREYCGGKKPFSRFVVLFDEFGRYTEFATIRSSVAGSGVLQDLFEGIQAKAEVACFIGFIQFELNAYMQRVSPEYRNDIKRYITRYQSANKAYLSVNLETLFANLLEKHDPAKLEDWFDNERERRKSKDLSVAIQSWFPLTRNRRLWRKPEPFHTVIRKGCWPLSPLSVWLLVYLTAAGKHLQERSALALLGEAFDRIQNTNLTLEKNWEMVPVDLWSDALREELLTAEDQGHQGAIVNAYSTVITHHGTKLTFHHQRILCAVVLASKMGLVVTDRLQANEALGFLRDFRPPR